MSIAGDCTPIFQAENHSFIDPQAFENAVRPAGLATGGSDGLGPKIGTASGSDATWGCCEMMLWEKDDTPC